MRGLSLYGIMSTLSVIVRQFYLPNPFECFGDNAVLINLIAEPIIHMVAYGIVGCYYIRGSAPDWGSLLYLLAYAFIVGVLRIMGIFSFAWWWILIVVLGIIVLIRGVIWLKERFE